MCCTCNLILCSGVAFRCIQLVLVHKILIWKIFLWLYTSVRAYYNGSQEYYIYYKMRTVCLVFCKNTVLRLKFEMQRSLEQFGFFHSNGPYPCNLWNVPCYCLFFIYTWTVHSRTFPGLKYTQHYIFFHSSGLKKRFLSTIDHCSL